MDFFHKESPLFFERDELLEGVPASCLTGLSMKSVFCLLYGL
jgi:hypothetical protein